MEQNDKPEQGKNGLRSYQYERVKRGKIVYDPNWPGAYQKFTNLFYTKKCSFCEKEFEARRVDTAFCCQGCQKADLRRRKRQTA